MRHLSTTVRAAAACTEVLALSAWDALTCAVRRRHVPEGHPGGAVTCGRCLRVLHRGRVA